MGRAAMQRATADAAISASGVPVIVYGVNMVSGATAGVLILRNGTSASATAVIQVNGVISQGVTKTFGKDGVVFPSGCFADLDTNVTQYTVFFEKV